MSELSLPPVLASLAIAAVALAATAVTDGLRFAILAAVVAGVITATRVRFAHYAAVALLVLVALVAVSGNGPQGDLRPSAHSTHAST